MQDAGFIDTTTMEAALAAPLLVEQPSVDTDRRAVLRGPRAPAARPALRPEGPHHPEPARSTRPSTCTCRALAQQALERGLDQVQEMIKKRTTAPVQGCLIALEPASGKVVALVGGRSYGRSQYNRVMQARRQPGSTFKPFVYLTAFEATFDDPSLPPITPATVVEDAPVRVLLRGQGVHPDQLRGHVPRHGDAAPRARDEHERGHGQGRGDGRLRQGGRPVVEEARDRRADPALPRRSRSARSRPRPSRWRRPTTCSPTAVSRSSRSPILAGGRREGPGARAAPRARARARRARGVGLPRHRHAAQRAQRGHRGERARRSASPPTPPARPAPPTTTATPGSPASRRTCSCVVWVGFDDNTPVGLSGTRAALPIWVDFMKSALGGTDADARSRPPPEGIVFVDDRQGDGPARRSRAARSTRTEAFVAGHRAARALRRPRRPAALTTSGLRSILLASASGA